MAAFNEPNESESSDPFQPYPAIHEDDFQSRYRNRYNYDFDQIRKKKRKVRSVVETNSNSNRDDRLEDDQLSDHEPLQPRVIPEDILVRVWY